MDEPNHEVTEKGLLEGHSFYVLRNPEDSKDCKLADVNINLIQTFGGKIVSEIVPDTLVVLSLDCKLNEKIKMGLPVDSKFVPAGYSVMKHVVKSKNGKPVDLKKLVIRQKKSGKETRNLSAKEYILIQALKCIKELVKTPRPSFAKLIEMVVTEIKTNPPKTVKISRSTPGRTIYAWELENVEKLFQGLEENWKTMNDIGTKEFESLCRMFRKKQNK